MSKRNILIITIMIILLAVLFVLEMSGFLKLLSPKENSQIVPNVAQQPLSKIDPSISTEVSDLLKIVYALERYKQDHRSYPVSSTEKWGWDGILSEYGESREDWIKGLVPHYIDKLPRDPRMLDDGTRQYVYISNGANYKLIVLRTTNCQVIKNSYPSLIDPVRDCSSYGFWTKGAAQW